MKANFADGVKSVREAFDVLEAEFKRRQVVHEENNPMCRCADCEYQRMGYEQHLSDQARD